MKTFLALYNAPAAVMEKWSHGSAEDKEKGMEGWMQWAEKHKDALVDMGTPVGKNKRVTKDGVSDERNEVGGYSIVQAESHEAAAAIFADNPHLDEPGTYIEVMEFKKM